jgi:hypothetical protein
MASPYLRVCVKTPRRVHISRVGNASTTMGRGYATLFSSFHTDSYVRGYHRRQTRRFTAADRRLTTADRWLTVADRLLTVADRRLTVADRWLTVAPRVSEGTRINTLER